MDWLKLVVPLVAIELILKVVSLVDLNRREPFEVRFEKRWVWALVILFVSTFGPIGYLLFGRRDSV
jgi:glucose uptake protein GlcU